MIRRAIRFVGDWKNLATLLATALVALLVVTYIDNVRSRVEATRNLKAEVAESAELRAAATRRIDGLFAQIQRLQAELVDAREGRGAIRAQLEAVIAQLRQMGVEPVATRSGPSPTSRASASPLPQPSPTPKPSPSPSPSPSPTCWIPIIGCP